jgi:hypothetical protein
MNVAALLAGTKKKQLWLAYNCLTAEAAARARDRAVLSLRRAGLPARCRLNFPEAAYQGEELLQLSGTAVAATVHAVSWQPRVDGIDAMLDWWHNDDDEDACCCYTKSAGSQNAC